MKPLDKNKKYDLSQLNDEQLQSVLEYIRTDDKDWIDITLKEFSTLLDLFRLCSNEDEWMWTTDLPTNNALELFDERLSNVKIDLKTPSDLTDEQRERLISMLKEEVEEEKTHDIYQRADQLMQDGKQHGLKIVVTFEKL